MLPNSTELEGLLVESALLKNILSDLWADLREGILMRKPWFFGAAGQ